MRGELCPASCLHDPRVCRFATGKIKQGTECQGPYTKNKRQKRGAPRPHVISFRCTAEEFDAIHRAAGDTPLGYYCRTKSLR